MELEPKLETKEDAIKLVESVFRSMGGKVLPPRRPGHLDKYAILTPERDAFMMDFENACLEKNFKRQFNEYPTGDKRYEDPFWGSTIRGQVYPQHSDVDWEEYCNWVQNGGGDEMFQEEDDVNEDGFFNDDVFWFDTVMAAHKTAQGERENEEEEDELRERMFEIEREEQEFLPGYLEAQTRLRTSYACKEMVRPLSTPLDERIVTMAGIVNGQRSPSTNL